MWGELKPLDRPPNTVCIGRSDFCELNELLEFHPNPAVHDEPIVARPDIGRPLAVSRP